MSLKKQLIKNYLKMQLISNNPGQLAIRIGSLPKLEDKYKSFQTNIVELLKILPGIGDIQTDFNTGDISITYNEAALQPQQVIKWINVLVDVVIDQMNFINKYWIIDIDYVMEMLQRILKEKAEYILTF